MLSLLPVLTIIVTLIYVGFNSQICTQAMRYYQLNDDVNQVFVCFLFLMKPNNRKQQCLL